MFRQLGGLIGHVSDTPTYTAITVMLSALVFGLLEFAIHLMLAYAGAPAFTDAVFDTALCGITFGLLLWLLLAAIRERRQRLREELERISEVNHEIRNALQIITDSHFNADPTHRQMVLNSVNRIDAVLKHVFASVGG